MLLQKGGVAFDVSHPSDIARLKRAGYKEVKSEEFAAEQQKIAEKAVGGKPLEKMTVDELKVLAEKSGVEGFETMKKSELVTALLNKRGGEQ